MGLFSQAAQLLSQEPQVPSSSASWPAPHTDVHVLSTRTGREGRHAVQRVLDSSQVKHSPLHGWHWPWPGKVPAGQAPTQEFSSRKGRALPDEQEVQKAAVPSQDSQLALHGAH